MEGVVVISQHHPGACLLGHLGGPSDNHRLSIFKFRTIIAVHSLLMRPLEANNQCLTKFDAMVPNLNERLSFLSFSFLVSYLGMVKVGQRISNVSWQYGAPRDRIWVFANTEEERTKMRFWWRIDQKKEKYIGEKVSVSKQFLHTINPY